MSGTITGFAPSLPARYHRKADLDGRDPHRAENRSAGLLPRKVSVLAPGIAPSVPAGGCRLQFVGKFFLLVGTGCGEDGIGCRRWSG